MRIFDIQRGSFHDGPGIRTVIFLKGCNMSCSWCQNPESQSGQTEMMFYENMCGHCSMCVDVCPTKVLSIGGEKIHYNPQKCILCRKCEDECCYGARYFVGKEVNEDEILREVLEDKEMYRISGGGLTLSGGEPLLQARSCKCLLEKAKAEGIHTLIETAGNVEWKCFEEILPYTDTIYIDLKVLDEKKHKNYCGCSNSRILFNIEKLHYTGITMKVRVPIIPGVNDDEKSIQQIADFLQEKGIKRCQLMPFHNLGSNKYTALGKKYVWSSYKTPSKTTMNSLKRVMEIGGIKCE